MPNIFYRITSALLFYRKARTIYQLHGPLAYELAIATLEDDRSYYAFEEIELLRRRLEEDLSLMKRGSWGAAEEEGKSRPFGKWVKRAALRPKWGQLLFRLALHRRPQRILELGTGAGISALYLSAACPESHLDTLEGHPLLAERAQTLFQRQERTHIQVHQGTFLNTLPQFKDKEPYDLIYVDGDHREEVIPSLFKALESLAHAETIIIFDDIRWSAGTERAWEAIRREETVRLSIDLFQFGLLFFSPRILEKQHVYLIHHRWKPWSMLRGW